MLGRADLGQPGIPKVPLRHAGHLSWGCVSQHSWRFPFTLCSEAVGPVAWQCVFGLERVEALLSVWLALWGWSLCLWSPPFRQSPLQTPGVSGSLLSVLSVPAVSGPAKGPLFPYVAGVRCNVVACVPRVTPSSSVPQPALPVCFAPTIVSSYSSRVCVVIGKQPVQHGLGSAIAMC